MYIALALALVVQILQTIQNWSFSLSDSFPVYNQEK